jgi:hypothetical protein
VHTCKPPISELNLWLSHVSTQSVGYAHLLLEEKQPSSPTIVSSLRPYFESAHLDAREFFHAEAGLDLHPDAANGDTEIQYPSCLPTVTRHGLFGEVLAGLVVEAYPTVGNHTWSVPVFLFRYHADVAKYLFALSRDGTRTRQLWGRLGDDFIGVSLGEAGDVQRLIVGEAKWRKVASQTVTDDLLLGTRVEEPKGSGTFVRKHDGILSAFQQAMPVPHGLKQLQKILIEKAPDEYAEAIVSLDAVLALRQARAIPRTDLVVIAGNSPTKRAPGTSNVSQVNRPAEYTAGRDLQVVELFLNHGEVLIETLYSSLWLESEKNVTP